MNEQHYRVAERRFWEHYGAPPSERWLNLSRPATKVRVQELGEGPPVLFLHGGPAAGTIFAPVAARLKDFRCILLDRPGCSLSLPVDYTQARIDKMMADIVNSCLDALELERVAIVTNSFGGACAIWFSQRYPNRVSRVAHLGCPAFVSQMQTPFMLRLLATPGLGYMAARLPMNRAGVMAFMKTMGQQQLLHKNGLPEAFVNWWISLARDTGTMRYERELIRNGLMWQGMRPELVIPDEAIRALDQPTYFYWGADEPFATTEYAAKLVQGMKKARIDFIPGSGHLPWFDDPPAAAAQVRAFLQEK